MNRINVAERIGDEHREIFSTGAAAHFGAMGGVKAQPSERKSTWAFLKPPAVGGRMAADIGRGVNDSTKPNSGIVEIYRVDPRTQVIRTVETANARIDLLRASKQDLMELECLKSRHFVILLTDGLSRGCEWSDGRQTRRVPFLAPNTVIFDPAKSYLRIRGAISQKYCHVLVLAIRPAVTSWHDDLEMDFAGVQFQQKIGLNDEEVRQTLVSMRQELEAPGINSAFYVDTLFFLLLTRLIRCASSLAEASLPTFAKGGLPNWRLKRAIDLLEGDPAKIPSLADVARVIGLHPTSFCRGFKQSTGLSPHRYTLVHRVNRAKEMMKDQRLTLTEIALDCGFSSSSQFSVVFRRVAGMSPREFRRML